MLYYINLTWLELRIRYPVFSDTMRSLAFKGKIHPNLKFHTISTHYYVDGGSGDISNPRSPSGVSQRKRIPRTQAEKTIEENHNMPPYCSCGVIIAPGYIYQLYNITSNSDINTVFVANICVLA